MKKQVILAVVALITVASFGQKREIRKAQRAVDSQEYNEALSHLNEAEALLESADEDEKSDYYVLRAVALTETAANDFTKMKAASEAINKALQMDPDRQTDLAPTAGKLRVALFNSAITDQNAKDFGMASDKFYASYNVSKKDTADLYYAAVSSINAKDYDTALAYYEQLMDLGFTGISEEYVATDAKTGEIKPFGSKSERDIMVKTGDFIKPETRKTKSKRGDILRNMTLIYVENDDQEKALKMIKTARAENPDDTALIRAEADLALAAEDMERFSELMNEIVATDPDNPEIYFNLGVGAEEMEDFEKAEEYYKQSIELDPNYSPSLINLGALLLKEESSIVEEMNNLGTSTKDNARYDELKAQREGIYTEVLPYFERAFEQESDNIGLARTLMNIYSQVGNDAKFEEMKTKVAELEG